VPARYPIRRPALDPLELPTQTGSFYPKPLDQVVNGRLKRRVGHALGLTDLGVSITVLMAGASTALRHYHTGNDEFVYVIDGEVSFISNRGEQVLSTGMCAGFPKGKKDGHHFVNKGDRPVQILEASTNTLPDSVVYPDNKLFLTLDAKRNATFINKPIKAAATNASKSRKKKRGKSGHRRTADRHGSGGRGGHVGARAHARSDQARRHH